MGKEEEEKEEEEKEEEEEGGGGEGEIQVEFCIVQLEGITEPEFQFLWTSAHKYLSMKAVAPKNMFDWLLSAAGPRQPDTSWLKADA